MKLTYKEELDLLWGNKDMKNQVRVMEAPAQNLQIAQSQQASSLLSIIEKIATTPEADAVKMQAVMDMYNQQVAREREHHKEDLAQIAKKEFNAEYVSMSGKLPLVIKTKSNAHTKSRYAALEDINEAVKPILLEHGFAITSDILEQSKENITVEIFLVHKGGHEKSIKLTFPLDNKGSSGTINKTDIHATASTITYARRIGECALLNISTGDDNNGNATNEILATEGHRTAISLLYQKLTPEHKEKFNDEFGGIAEIKKKDVDAALARLNGTLKNYKTGAK